VTGAVRGCWVEKRRRRKMLDALEVKITLPNAWITEDGVLFMRSYTYAPLQKVFENSNKALEESGYEERIGLHNFRPPFPRVWVDPAYVAAERWPESAVATERTEGWVCLYRVDVEALAALGGGE
jgi:hypothetical protein